MTLVAPQARSYTKSKKSAHLKTSPVPPFYPSFSITARPSPPTSEESMAPPPRPSSPGREQQQQQQQQQQENEQQRQQIGNSRPLPPPPPPFPPPALAAVAPTPLLHNGAAAAGAAGMTPGEGLPPLLSSPDLIPWRSGGGASAGAASLSPAALGLVGVGVVGGALPPLPQQQLEEKQHARRESRRSVGADRQQLQQPQGSYQLATGSSNINSRRQPAAMIHCSVQAQL